MRTLLGGRRTQDRVLVLRGGGGGSIYLLLHWSPILPATILLRYAASLRNAPPPHALPSRRIIPPFLQPTFLFAEL